MTTTTDQANDARPKEVTRGVQLLNASLVLGLLRAILNLVERTSGTTLIVSGLFVVVFFALWFFIVMQISARRNLARILVLIIVVVLILSIPVTLLLVPGAVSVFVDDFRRNIFIGILGVLISLLQLLGTYLLFTTKSNQWFKTSK